MLQPQNILKIHILEPNQKL